MEPTGNLIWAGVKAEYRRPHLPRASPGLTCSPAGLAQKLLGSAEKEMETETEGRSQPCRNQPGNLPSLPHRKNFVRFRGPVGVGGYGG